MLGVQNKDYEAAAIANSVMKRMFARKVADPTKIRVIYKSQTFPTTGYGHVYNLDPGLVAKLRTAFLDFNWEGTELLKEFSKSEPPQEKFMAISYKQHWEVVRQIDKAMGVSYACK